MPTFDIVSKIDMQEVTNAVANSMKEITQRYDFKGSKSNLDLKEKSIVLETEDLLVMYPIYHQGMTEFECGFLCSYSHLGRAQLHFCIFRFE